MKRFIYQIKHWYHVNRIYIKNYGFNFKTLFHDLDKIWYICMWDFDDHLYKVRHRRVKHHHLSWMLLHKNLITERDINELICDWESSRFSKPNKKLNAKEQAIIETEQINQLPLQFKQMLINKANSIKS